MNAGHCECVKHTMTFQRPLLITGGGGYTKSNVARCWTNETAALVQKEISPRLPPCQYDEYFSVKDQDPTLRLKYSGEKPCENLNKQEDINRLFEKVMSRLEDIRSKPTSSGKVWLLLLCMAALAYTCFSTSYLSQEVIEWIPCFAVSPGSKPS